MTKCANFGVCVRLIEGLLNTGLIIVGRNFGTQAGIHLIEGILLIWGPLNTGFTVIKGLGAKGVKKIILANQIAQCFACTAYLVH